MIVGIPLLFSGAAAPTGPVMLLGNDTLAGSSSWGGGQNYVFCFQFTAAATGVATEVRYTNALGYNLGSVAIYADNGANAPGARLSTSVADWHNDLTIPLPISPVTLTAGTKYWIAYASGHGLFFTGGAPGPEGFFRWPSSTPLPATALAFDAASILGMAPDIAAYQV